MLKVVNLKIAVDVNLWIPDGFDVMMPDGVDHGGGPWIRKTADLEISDGAAEKMLNNIDPWRLDSVDMWLENVRNL